MAPRIADTYLSHISILIICHSDSNKLPERKNVSFFQSVWHNYTVLFAYTVPIADTAPIANTSHPKARIAGDPIPLIPHTSHLNLYSTQAMSMARGRLISRLIPCGKLRNPTFLIFSQSALMHSMMVAGVEDSLLFEPFAGVLLLAAFWQRFSSMNPAPNRCCLSTRAPALDVSETRNPICNNVSPEIFTFT